MKERYKKHNHTQKGDFTKTEKTYFLKHYCPIADFIKIVNDTTGLFDRLGDPAMDRLDKRTREVEYSFHFMLVVSALACCLGISAVNTFSSTFIEPQAVANIAYLTDEPTTIVADYKTINTAIGGMGDVSWIETLAQDICEKMQRSGRYSKYRKWYGTVVVIDATDFAFFRTSHCEHDLTVTFHKGQKDQTTYYYHKALVARLFFTKTISFPIGIEFIENKEPNPNKQDCENKAAIRLLERLKKRFPLMQFIICGDALYANKTFIKLCLQNGWNYLFTLRDGCQPSLCAEFHSMIAHGIEDGHARIRYDGKETGTVYWVNDMGNVVDTPLPMNILIYRTNITVTKSTRKVHGIQNAILRQKDISLTFSELSKDQSEYDLDGRNHGKKAKALRENAVQKEQDSSKALEALNGVNQEQAKAVGDGQISANNVKDGDTIEVTFMYITNFPIKKCNVCDLLVRGRSRWLIEECFLCEKVGNQKLEHLKSKNYTVMKYYFWMENIADSCMKIFLDNSRALGVYGSEAEVYRKLRESFEKDSLEANENTGRACHWHYGYVENDYPTAEIIPDEKPEKKDSQHDKSDDSSVEKKADAGTSSSPSGKNSLKMDVTSGQDSLSDEAEAEKTSSELSAEKTAVPSVTDTSDDSVPSPNPALGSGPVSETNYDDTIVGKGKDQDLSEQSEEEPALTDSVDTGGKAGGRPLSDKTLSVSGHTADVDKTKAKPGAPGNKEVWVPGDSCSTPVVTGQVAGETLVKIPAIGTCPVKKVTIGGTEAMGGRVTPTVPESTHGKTGTKKGGGLSAVRKFDSEMAA